jgi:hypothetical protein
VGLLIDNLSPILFTLAITLMGVEIAPDHSWLGFVCISAAVGIYGVRAAILQMRYARSQEELTKAMIAAEQASRAKSGGEIDLKSIPGEGTTITFDAYFGVSGGSQPAQPIPSEEDLQGMRTLIIDDNATNRTILL